MEPTRVFMPVATMMPMPVPADTKGPLNNPLLISLVFGAHSKPLVNKGGI
jgi:hypothetical protein